ncbi:unnamed protein product [Mesocestoides corti]|uniref:MLX-interacting protein n=2 Tax=Mesocestoides corti TaxID=53468 RepID=A0A0R3ULM7_MESCO|nr:unnamed protein product [Mesocestoides corti]
MCETEKHSEIQSGQFMISKLDDSESEKEDVESLEDFETVTDHKTSGLPAFDGLQSLFKSLSLAYVETLTSPRWSHFKGTGFALKQKVRLNNIIWREYHMQYVKQLPPVIVKFQVPSCDETHIKAQCLVMEGKFWNRHSKKLSNEYRRWRTFFINHLRKKPPARSDKRRPDFDMPLDFPSKIQYLEEKDILSDVPSISGVGSPRFIDELMRDFDGSLDLFLDQPFPNPRDMSMLGNSDIMQPGLTQLQPNSENCRSDLIASLLQQPVMPTIAEDEYLSNDYQQVAYNTQEMFSAYQQSMTPQYQNHYRPYNALPSSHQQVLCRGQVTGKQFHQQQQQHQPVAFNRQSSAQGKCLRFVQQPIEPQPPPQQQPPRQLHENRRQDLSKSPDTPRSNLTLLNALLQKPKPIGVSSEGLRERHHSASSDTRFGVSPAQARPLPPPATSALDSTNSQFNRQLSSSSSNALIVDLSKDRISPIDPSPSVFLDDLSSGFTGAVDQVQQHQRQAHTELYGFEVT